MSSDWTEYKDENGTPYFYNARTGETTWDSPTRKFSETNDIQLNPVVPPPSLSSPVSPSMKASLKPNHERHATSSAYVPPQPSYLTSSNVPKGTGLNSRKYIKIIALVLLSLIITAVVLYFILSKLVFAPSPSSGASNNLNTVSNLAYSPSTQSLSLSQSSIGQADQLTLLSSLFNLASLVFTNVKPFDFNNPNDPLTNGIAPNLLNLLKLSVAAKTFTGTFSTNFSANVNGPIPSMLSESSSCYVALFYALNETSFTPSSVQFAVQCSISASWQPNINSINGILSSGPFSSMPSAAQSTTTTWFSDFQIIANATIIVSTVDSTFFSSSSILASYTSDWAQSISSAASLLPQTLPRGLTITAMVTPRIGVNAPASGPLGGVLDSVLSRSLGSLPPFGVQFSLPFNLTYVAALNNNGAGTGFNSNIAAPKLAVISNSPFGYLWLPNTPALPTSFKFSDSSILPAPFTGLTVAVQGWGSSNLQFQFATSVLIAAGSISNSNGPIHVDVAGSYSQSTSLLSLNGNVKAGFTPLPTVSISAGALVTIFALYSPASGSVPASFSLCNVTMHGGARLSFSDSPGQQLNFEGTFTNNSLLIVIDSAPVSSYTVLVNKQGGSTLIDPVVFSNLQSQLPSLNTGTVSVAFSSFPSNVFSPLLGQSVYPGLSFSVRGLSVNNPSTIFNGALSGPLSTLTAGPTNAPGFSIGNMDFMLSIPLSVFTNQPLVPARPVSFSLSARNVQVYDFTLTSLTFIFNLPTTSTTASPSSSPSAGVNWAGLQTSLEASFTLSIPMWSSSPLSFHALASYTPATATAPNTLSFTAGLASPAPVSPFGWSWLTLSATTFSASFYSLGTSGPMSYSVSLSTMAQFHLSAQATTPIPLAISLIDGTVTLSAKSVSINSIYPELANYVGVLGTTPVDIILTTAHGASPLTIQKSQSIIDNLNLMNANNRHLLSVHNNEHLTSISLPPISSFSSYLPSSFAASLPGLNIIGNNIALSQTSGFGGAFSVLSSNGVSATTAFNLTVNLPFSATQLWYVDLRTGGPGNPPIAFSSAVSLTYADINFGIIPSPLSINASLTGALSISLPSTPTLSLVAGGSYNSLNSSINLYGQLGPWSGIFGLPWLSMGTTDVQLSSSPAFRTLSLHTSAKFNNTVGVEVCGGVVDSNGSPQVGLALYNVGLGKLADSLCTILNICAITDPMITSINIGNVQLFLHLANAAFSIDPTTNTQGMICPLPSMSPGVSIGASVNIQGLLADKLRAVWSNIDSILGNGVWNLIAALPFGQLNENFEPMSDEKIYQAMLLKLASESGRPFKNSLETFALNANNKDLIQHARFLSTLGPISGFNVNFQNDQLNINLTNSLAIQGLGVVGTPFASPPTVRMYITLRVILQSNPDPLMFKLLGDISASVLGVQVTLTGTLQVSGAGWVNPFGIKGLIVHSVGASVGFAAGSPIGLSSLGLGFSVTLGSRINLAFAGSINIGTISNSYVTASISSTDNQPLALIDFVQAVVQMSNGVLSMPSGNSLPGPNILSVTSANFSLATTSGIDLNNKPYPAGLWVSAVATIFGIQISMSGGTTSSPTSLVPVTDFVFNFAANLAVFNQEIISWINSIIPFDPATVAGSGTGLCQIACVNSFSLTGLSVAGLVTKGSLPSFSMSISIVGQTINIGPTPASLATLGGSASDFFNTFKSQFSLNFCVVDANCPSGNVCDHTDIKGKCISGCASGYTHVPLIGCVKNLFLDGKTPLDDPYTAAANYVPPTGWWVPLGINIYDQAAWNAGLAQLRAEYLQSLLQTIASSTPTPSR